MPAFFIISGFFLNVSKWKSKGFKAFLISRCQKYLIPYFFFEFLWGFIVTFVFIQPSREIIVTKVITTLIRPFTIYVNYVPSWFLITLFFSAFLIYLLDNKDNKVIVGEIVILLVITVIGKHFRSLSEDDGIRGIMLFVLRIILSSSFMLIGLLWRRIDLSRFKNFGVTLGCLALIMIMPFITDWESISSFSIKYVTPFVITGIAGTGLIVALSKVVNCKALQFIGRESLLIFGTHQFVEMALRYNFSELYSSKYVNFIYLAGVIVFELITVPLINKFLPFLVGKKALILPQKLMVSRKS